MASYSSTVLALVLICVCSAWQLKKVACIRRPVGGAAQYDAADNRHGSATWKQANGYHKASGASAAWKQTIGYAGSSGGTWKQEIGCSPCAEVYVVRDDGETLQTISEKCHAPFILLDNPHVQDTDDISAGSVLLISSTHLPC